MQKYRKAMIFLLSLLLCFALALPQFSPTTPPEDKVYNIVFEEEPPIELLEKKDIKVVQEYEHVQAVTVAATPSELREIANLDGFISYEKDRIVRITSQQVDWGHTKIGTSKARSIGLTGTGIKVAVIDTGISTSHQDLTVVDGVSTVNDVSSYNDDHGHGTHVAGIIAAKDNSIGTVGVAPNASLYAIKALDSDGSGYVSWIIAGIDWAISKKVDIINMSLGTTSNIPSFEAAVDRAKEAGILVVASTGNTPTRIGYPGAYDSVVGIGATDDTNTIASFSGRGTGIDFVAPGVSILSTYLNNSTARMSGTSMATPYATGIFALFKEHYPSWTNNQIITSAKSTAIDLGIKGYDTIHGYGLLQVPTTANGEPTPSPTTSQISKNIVYCNGARLYWTNSGKDFSYELWLNGKRMYKGERQQFATAGLRSGQTYAVKLVTISKTTNEQEYRISSFKTKTK